MHSLGLRKPKHNGCGGGGGYSFKVLGTGRLCLPGRPSGVRLRRGGEERDHGTGDPGMLGVVDSGMLTGKLPGVVVHTCASRAQEDEAGDCSGFKAKPQEPPGGT